MPTLQIHHLQAEYRIAQSISHPATLQRRFDRIATQLLARTLEEQLSDLPDADESLYFIEQLEVNFTLDGVNWDDRQLAIAWAKALQSSVVRAIAQRGSSIILFANRGEFLASFVEDLLHGTAWDYWYYQEFTALRSASVSQAIAQVLIADGDVGRDALLELTRHDNLERVLRVLAEADVAAIAQHCLLPPGPEVILPNTCGVWIRELRSLLATGIPLTSTIPRDVIYLYLNLLRQRPELGPDVNLARFIQNILTLQQTVMGLSDRPAFLTHIASENWTEVFHLMGRSPLQPLLRTLSREVAGADLVALLQDLQVEEPQPLMQRLMTAYGGIFFLVGAIADLDLYSFLQACPYPDPEGLPKANLLLWLMALQCLGQGNLSQAWSDRGVLLFAGLTQAPERDWLASYAARLTEAMHRAFMQDLQAHCQRVIRLPDRFAYRRSLSTLPEPSEWLSLCGVPHSPLPDAIWDQALGRLGAIALQGFAAKLGALAGSSPSYLSRNFLESEAEIGVSETAIALQFLTCPLQMVLRMAGFEDFRWQVSWVGERELILKFD